LQLPDSTVWEQQRSEATHLAPRGLLSLQIGFGGMEVRGDSNFSECKLLVKRMVGTWGLEPQTSTVSRELFDVTY